MVLHIYWQCNSRLPKSMFRFGLPSHKPFQLKTSEGRQPHTPPRVNLLRFVPNSQTPPRVITELDTSAFLTFPPVSAAISHNYYLYDSGTGSSYHIQIHIRHLQAQTTLSSTPPLQHDDNESPKRAPDSTVVGLQLLFSS